ncbi:MAG TPA: hypothetical protein VMS04_00260, partial [Vicinamibacterales bacterium]|nr:hypothetical protein [Vicinamibacterales bacterium]
GFESHSLRQPSANDLQELLADGVHVERTPQSELSKFVDRRAKVLGVSRNRLIVRALEQAIRERSGWTPEFLEKLRLSALMK